MFVLSDVQNNNEETTSIY